MPYFVLDVLNYPGVNGIFLAVLFSGALRLVSCAVQWIHPPFSSLSSSMNSAAAVTWEDLLKRFLHHISEDKKALITKLLGKQHVKSLWHCALLIFSLVSHYVWWHCYGACILSQQLGRSRSPGWLSLSPLFTSIHFFSFSSAVSECLWRDCRPIARNVPAWSPLPLC